MINGVWVECGVRHSAAVAWANGREPTGKLGSHLVWALPAEVRAPAVDSTWDSCACDWCSPDRDARPCCTGPGWDILIVGVANSGVVEAWSAHGPEFHGKRRKRAAGVVR